MNDIFAKRRARLLAMKAIRDNYIPGDKLVSCPIRYRYAGIR